MSGCMSYNRSFLSADNSTIDSNIHQRYLSIVSVIGQWSSFSLKRRFVNWYIIVKEIPRRDFECTCSSSWMLFGGSALIRPCELIGVDTAQYLISKKVQNCNYLLARVFVGKQDAWYIIILSSIIQDRLSETLNTSSCFIAKQDNKNNNIK